MEFFRTPAGRLEERGFDEGDAGNLLKKKVLQEDIKNFRFPGMMADKKNDPIKY